MGAFEQNQMIENLGRRTGYLFSYVVFTTMLFLAVFLLGRLPSGWSLLHIAGITAAVAVFGAMLKRWLG